MRRYGIRSSVNVKRLQRNGREGVKMVAYAESSLGVEFGTPFIATPDLDHLVAYALM